ncbi:MAG: putative lipid II flippase FtsW [Candidatus Omnitrophica bacterium]|nr:putative lipid II flippase FtsW [Candidatus Omnitrophota bacterium]MBU0896909.1 putative lipid II flippase FtsW [Candidatus Omnitrophota bacterium]MBU1811088.1 putative lipid II flippase FtsW [Candidatus Omnitrophota bacterium]
MNEKVSQSDPRSERRFIFTIILALTLFGILMIYESSSIYAFRITADHAYFLKRQFIFFLLGLGLFFLFLLPDIESLAKYNKEFLILTAFFLIVVLFTGRSAGGAKRWFYFGNFSFQPSEMLKISFLLYCAEYFRRKGNLIRNFKLGLLPLGFVLGLICFLLILEPDLGGVIFWIIWVFLSLFFIRAKKRHLFLIISLGLAASFFLIIFEPYRFRRISAYLNPFADSQGAGFQLVQSQIAYGTGGIWGVGLGEGKQKLFFLPAAHTDFIFSIIAEELGLFGSLGVLFAFFLLFKKMVNIAKGANDEFKRNILWGIIFIFFLEVIINIGVSCGLFPTKGLPLPFVSYGGSSLVVHYILLGLFFNASREDQRVMCNV